MMGADARKTHEKFGAFFFGFGVAFAPAPSVGDLFGVDCWEESAILTDCDNASFITAFRVGASVRVPW